MAFGEWLTSELTERGISMAELARLMRINPGAVSRWGSNQRLPDPESCRRIALVLGISEELVLKQAGHESYRGIRGDQLRQEIEGLRNRHDMLLHQRAMVEASLPEIEERLRAATKQLELLEREETEHFESLDLFALIDTLPLSMQQRDGLKRRIWTEFDRLRTTSMRRPDFSTRSQPAPLSDDSRASDEESRTR